MANLSRRYSLPNIAQPSQLLKVSACCGSLARSAYCGNRDNDANNRDGALANHVAPVVAVISTIVRIKLQLSFLLSPFPHALTFGRGAKSWIWCLSARLKRLAAASAVLLSHA